MSARQSAEVTKAHVIKYATKIAYPLRGIYFLIKAGEIIYIGQTPNVYRRIGEHATKKLPDAYFLIPISLDEMSDIELGLAERRYIDRLKPALNIQKGFWQNLPEGHRSTPAVERALKLVDGGATAYAAAKKTGIALSTIYRALRRRRCAIDAALAAEKG